MKVSQPRLGNSLKKLLYIAQSKSCPSELGMFSAPTKTKVGVRKVVDK